MMPDSNELIAYWIKSSNNDFQAMSHLFDKGHYTWALFVGHLVVEKLLKALYMQTFETNPPFIHDLYRLAEKCSIDLDEDQKDSLDTITTFNIQARYDDFKMEFYKKCTRKFTKEWIDSITELRKWIKENHLNKY